MAKRFEELWGKRTKKVVGLNSGTSCDGIDAAVVEIEGWGITTRVKLLAFENIQYSPAIQKKISALFRPETGRVDRICSMNFYLGQLFAAAALKIIAATGLKPADIDLIGSHGQTVYHLPEPILKKRLVRSTLQIGEPAVIAERTGILTVADFRVRDLAAGGQGAPLVPYVDYLLFGGSGKIRIIQNIGGIGNLTLVGGPVGFEEILAFDTGPGNMVIDEIVKKISNGQMRYDHGGNLAGKGRVSADLLEELLAHPFLLKDPPKTTGREEFGVQFAERVFRNGKTAGMLNKDLVATVTAFTVESIARSYEKFVFPRVYPDEVIIGGGGAYNVTLLAMLQKRLAPIPVLRHEDFGISSDAKEAIAFAILANETIYGIPANVPSATGANRPVVLGKVVF